jgi:hypothetical protein
MPVLGILTDHPYPLPRSFARFCSLGEKIGLQVYFFLPGAVDWKSGRLWAILWNGTTWFRDWVVLPDMIYNQVKYRHIANSHFCLRDLHGFQNRSIPVLNPYYFDRWTVHQTLFEKVCLRPYLPETVCWDYRQDSLSNFLLRHTTLFVKLRHGSKSRGIFRLRYHEGAYELKGLNRSGRIHTGTYDTIEKVVAYLQKSLAKELCLIQKGVSIEDEKGYRSDTRYLLQRSTSEEWEVTCAYRKTASPRHVVTGLASDAIHEFLPYPAQDVHATSLAMKTANQLAKNLGPLCEIALDIGRDSEGRLFLLEADAHYSRHPLPRKFRILSMSKPLIYAKHIISTQT